MNVLHSQILHGNSLADERLKLGGCSGRLEQALEWAVAVSIGAGS